MMSPPSCATAGRTRVSISSLIWAMTSGSPSSPTAVSSSSADPVISGTPRVKCSMMAPRIAGFRCFQSPSRLVTEMKSEPKNTRLTSGTANSAVASGERLAVSATGKSATWPSPMTSRPGRNFSVFGLGVDSVWMNIGGTVGQRALHGPCGHANQGDPPDGTGRELCLLQRGDHDRRGRGGYDLAVLARKRRVEEVDRPPALQHARFRDVAPGAALVEIAHLHLERRCDLAPFQHHAGRHREHVVHHAGDGAAMKRAEAVEMRLAEVVADPHPAFVGVDFEQLLVQPRRTRRLATEDRLNVRRKVVGLRRIDRAAHGVSICYWRDGTLHKAKGKTICASQCSVTVRPNGMRKVAS